eukprot:TRINITY_DN5893_c0_g1_i1.p2 TRINITY_DN5893_c0_g1~~TRINITY_DN5893_c0_g1_i1.p2  ORF type:complete len:178 (+),score=40.38 TRINITY_DN5893_c0_g1_i1:77-610(+)
MCIRDSNAEYMGLHIIRKGQCKVCITATAFRPAKRLQFTKNPPVSLHSTRARIIASNKEIEEASRKISKERKEFIAYKNNIQLGNLVENDTFGGKSLFVDVLEDEKASRSLLSIVADSAEVEVLIITRDLLSYLSNAQRVSLSVIPIGRTLCRDKEECGCNEASGGISSRVAEAGAD